MCCGHMSLVSGLGDPSAPGGCRGVVVDARGVVAKAMGSPMHLKKSNFERILIL